MPFALAYRVLAEFRNTFLELRGKPLAGASGCKPPKNVAVLSALGRHVEAGLGVARTEHDIVGPHAGCDQTGVVMEQIVIEAERELALGAKASPTAIDPGHLDDGSAMTRTVSRRSGSEVVAEQWLKG